MTTRRFPPPWSVEEQPALDRSLVDFDPGCFDDSLPLLGILFQKPCEFSRQPCTRYLQTSRREPARRLGQAFSGAARTGLDANVEAAPNAIK
jgi:hypothetical protein